MNRRTLLRLHLCTLQAKAYGTARIGGGGCDGGGREGGQSERERGEWCIHKLTYIYICVCVHVYGGGESNYSTDKKERRVSSNERSTFSPVLAASIKKKHMGWWWKGKGVMFVHIVNVYLHTRAAAKVAKHNHGH